MKRSLSLAARSFSSIVRRGPGVTGLPPLNEAFAEVGSIGKGVINGANTNTTQVTTLPNGLRVASIPQSGGMCSVGVVVESGARNEGKHKKGVAHFLEKLSFSSTTKFESQEHIVSALEPYGGMYESLHFRDVGVYTISCLPDGLETATDILSQALIHAKITDSEIQEARESIACELEMFKLGADQEPIVTDCVHHAAYAGESVGRLKICPIESLTEISRSDIMSFYSENFRPSRMVLVGVGVDHGDLVKCGAKYFPANLSAGSNQVESAAIYTGGHCYRHDDTPPPMIGPQELPTLTHVSIGFESSSHQADEYVKFCVLNTLMGGGGSFSAGGPGKGMYTRLYLQVLNRYHWMYSALALNHPYQETGLFTINASSHPNHGWDLVQVLIRQFKEMGGKINHGELERAKIQLKSTLLMNLEYRNIVLEDIGRQVVAAGHRKTAPELCAMIDAVTPQQLQEIVTRMLRQKPAVGAFGDLKHVPAYEEIAAAFERENGELTNRISHFLLRGARAGAKKSGLIKH